MKIKIAPMNNIECGFTLVCCKGCGVAIAHYDPNYVMIFRDDSPIRSVYHDVCLIAELDSAPIRGKKEIPDFFSGQLLTNGGSGWPAPLEPSLHTDPPTVIFAPSGTSYKEAPAVEIAPPGTFSCGCHHDGRQITQNVCELHKESVRRNQAEGEQRAHREWTAALADAFGRHGITKSPTVPNADVIESILVEELS